MIVADASPLIFIGRLGLLDVLSELLGPVLVPNAVFAEATAIPGRPGALSVLKARDSGHLTVAALEDASVALALSELVDAGEAEAIALALERKVERILMDDLAGRRLAKQVGLQPVGTLGFLVQARRTERIADLPGCLDVLETAGFRMTAELRTRVEQLAIAAGSEGDR